MSPLGVRRPLTAELAQHDVDVSRWVTPDAFEAGYYQRVLHTLDHWVVTDYPFTRAPALHKLARGEHLLPGAVPLPAPEQGVHRRPSSVLGWHVPPRAPTRIHHRIPSINWRLLHTTDDPAASALAATAPA